MAGRPARPTDPLSFELLADIVPVGVFLTDAEGLCTAVNPCWSELTGISPTEALGAGWRRAVHPDDAAAVGAAWAAAVLAGGEFQRDLRVQRPDGWVQWVQCAARAVRAPNGTVLAYLGTLTDISRLKAADLDRARMLAVERAGSRLLAAQNERLAQLVATLRAAVLVEDEHSRVVVANQAFCDLFGVLRSPGDMIGDDVTEAPHLGKHLLVDPEGFVDRIRALLAAREAVVNDELTFTDGRLLERNFTPIFVDGNFRGVLWTYADVTVRRLAEAERASMLDAEQAAKAALAVQNEELRSLDQMKNEFVASVSHELRTPLTSIISFAGLLADGAAGELATEQAEFVEIVARNAARLLRLVDDLLLLARLQTGTVSFDPAPLDVADLVREATTSVAPAIAAKGLLLSVDLRSGPPIVGDRARLHQVLDNLISNATKFTPPGGSVTVRAGPVEGQPGGWRISVADTGIGIPAADLDLLFTRFSRASNAREQTIPGTGLGLVLAKAIVELHGGTITVATEEGRGTEFRIDLPEGATCPVPQP